MMEPMGEAALLVRFDGGMSADNTVRVHALFHRLSAVAGLTLHPAYASLLVEFDPLLVSYAEVEALVTPLLAATAVPLASRTVEIPVVYDGPDLDDVAKATGLSREEVVARHCGAVYTAAFLGFQPGFAYLMGLPASLAVPRLAVPRLKVPAGSVGIAGNQTGIYPASTPGGWRLIGRTDAELFSPGENPPVLIAMGDRVRFKPV